MKRILLDTAVLLDLALSFQRLRGRVGSVASSSATAIEALVLYNVVLVDGPSFLSLTDGPRATRYLEYYCEDVTGFARQLSDLSTFCGDVAPSEGGVGSLYRRVGDLIEAHLMAVEDQNDLRAFELYDYLPYHLGEDPTAIECQLAGKPASDLEALLGEFPPELAPEVERVCSLLRARAHPTRAAWALPVLRLLYYQVLQQSRSLHYVPHLTKSTIAFGRPQEQAPSRRFLEYCEPSSREDYRRRVRETLGREDVWIPIPGVAPHVLGRSRRWADLLGEISELRRSDHAGRFRLALEGLLEVLSRGKLDDFEEAMASVAHTVGAWQRQLPGASSDRGLRVSLPFFEEPAHDRAKPLMLSHQVRASVRH